MEVRSMAERVPTMGRSIAARVPSVARTARAGARSTTSSLQRIPDPTLRWLAATSIGMAAGLHAAGAPRLIRAAGITPALLIGIAVAMRPIEPFETAGRAGRVSA
jgi:hypothetical protein